MISDDEYARTVRLIGVVARIAEDLPLGGMLERIGRAETLAPFVDPTLYRDFLFDPKAQADMEALKEMIAGLQRIQVAARALKAAHA